MGNLGDLTPPGSVAVGVIVGLISTSLQAIGLTLQRKSHILEDEKTPYDLRRPPYKRRRWQLGILMFVFANIVGSTIQITTLPLPVLSTLQASGLVFNTIFATLILGEQFTRYSLFGTVLVCIGAVLIAIFGAIEEPAHRLDQLLELLQRREFILWMVGTAIVVLVILGGTRTLRLFYSHHRSKYSNFLRFPHSPRPPPMVQSRVKLIRGLSYGLVSGILSAHSLLLAKSAVELLVRTVIDHVNQFNRWQSWAILISMIAVALTQMFYLHRGLKLCSTSVLYPFVFCIYNIIAILDGLIYFRQVSQLNGSHAGLIALGTAVLLSGVLCLSWRLGDTESHSGTIGQSTTASRADINYLDDESATEAAAYHHTTSSNANREDVDEESQAGERRPLLQHAGRTRRQKKRTPSLTLTIPSMHHPHRASTSEVNSASIWAELDDSDYEFDPFDRGAMNRSRSKSGSFFSLVGSSNSGYTKTLSRQQQQPVNGPSHTTRTRSLVGHQMWNDGRDDRQQQRRRRSQQNAKLGGWNHSGLLSSSNDGRSGRRTASLGGYGTVGTFHDDGDDDDDDQREASSRGREHSGGLTVSLLSSPDLAGSRSGTGRSTMRTMWQMGKEYVQRWMGWSSKVEYRTIDASQT